MSLNSKRETYYVGGVSPESHDVTQIFVRHAESEPLYYSMRLLGHWQGAAKFVFKFYCCVACRMLFRVYITFVQDP
jgi:hypothetical protein